MMSRDVDCDLNEPVVVVFGPEYGSRAGQKIQVKAIQYSLIGPVVCFPGSLGCKKSGDVVSEETNTLTSIVLENVELHTNFLRADACCTGPSPIPPYPQQTTA